MNPSSVEGRALVASPYLTDPNFRKTVVYIIKHDEDGAYGLVLNRPTGVTVGDLATEILKTPSSIDEPIFNGGPVEGPVVILHQRADLESTECAPGVYLSANQAGFMALCSEPEGLFRVFSSYSGWGPGQLEDELQHGGWLIWDITREDVFSDPEEIWQHAVKQIGREILADGLDMTRVPIDPTFN